MGRGAAGVDPRGGTIVGRGTELWETPPVEYPGHFLVKRVTNAGTIRLKKRLLFLANALKQHPVGLEEVEDGIWSIHFCHVLLGRVDERVYIIRTYSECVTHVDGYC